MTTLKQMGERELIRRLARRLPRSADVRVGIGDDAAVVVLEGAAQDLVLTSDAVIEGIHFLPGAPAERIGHKAVGRALSDLAAMGAEPLWALVDLVAPPDADSRRIERIYRGAVRLANHYGLTLVGGDTSGGPCVELHVFGVGQVPKSAAVLRSGARVGDALYVTGALGGSLKRKHLAFDPRVEEGLWLRECGWANAMIDVSDGLVTDLQHILNESRVGAVIHADRIPVSKAAGPRGSARALAGALYDGEDFELLFAVSAEKVAAFESSWREFFRLACTCIGNVTARRGGLMLVDSAGRRTRLRDAGYEHFAGGKRPAPTS
jgi:thiamine-monophosphate kinase